MKIKNPIALMSLQNSSYAILKTFSVRPEIFEALSEGYVLIDIAGNILYMNTKAKNILECDCDLKKVNIRQLVYKKDFAVAMKSFMTLIKTGFFSNYATRLRVDSDSTKNVKIDASVIYDATGIKPIAIQGTIVECLPSAAG